MQQEISNDHSVAVLFGREDRGLTNDELQRCNQHLNIPTNAEYSSLNLAMAVQVVAYELRMACLEADASVQNPGPTDDWDAPWVEAQDMERFYTHLEETLVELDFLKAEAPRQLMTRLRRLFSRQRMDAMELNILRGILTAAQGAVRRNTKTD
jgi:tRNA (cytidine32/uridine32-2'-O)-methyltransferase